MKNSPPPTGNVSRPRAFLAAKHVIMNAKDRVDCVQAQKVIDNYIFKMCEPSLRKDHQLDLLYILNWKIAQLRDDGIDTPEPQTIGAYECPMETYIHARQMESR